MKIQTGKLLPIAPLVIELPTTFPILLKKSLAPIFGVGYCLERKPTFFQLQSFLGVEEDDLFSS